jgi:hypothetical protein
MGAFGCESGTVASAAKDCQRDRGPVAAARAGCRAGAVVTLRVSGGAVFRHFDARGELGARGEPPGRKVRERKLAFSFRPLLPIRMLAVRVVARWLLYQPPEQEPSAPEAVAWRRGAPGQSALEPSALEKEKGTLR